MIDHEVRARAPIRERLESDFQQYIESGGKVEKLPQHEISTNSPRFNNKGKGVNYDSEEEV